MTSELYLAIALATTLFLAWCAPKAKTYKVEKQMSWLTATLLGGVLWPLTWFLVALIKVMDTSEGRKHGDD